MRDYTQNVSKVLFASEAGSFATRTSSDINNPFGRNLIIALVLANKLGTVTFTPGLQMKLTNGSYVTIWTAAAAVSANGTTTYMLGDVPDTESTQVTEVKSLVLPSIFRVVLTYSGAGDGNEFDTYAEYQVTN